MGRSRKKKKDKGRNYFKLSNSFQKNRWLGCIWKSLNKIEIFIKCSVLTFSPFLPLFFFLSLSLSLIYTFLFHSSRDVFDEDIDKRGNVGVEIVHISVPSVLQVEGCFEDHN